MNPGTADRSPTVEFNDPTPNPAKTNRPGIDDDTGDPDFVNLVDGIQAFSSVRERKSVSLKLEDREAERAELSQKRLDRENVRRHALGLEPLETTEALEELEPRDVLLDEAAKIVAEFDNRADNRNVIRIFGHTHHKRFIDLDFINWHLYLRVGRSVYGDEPVAPGLGVISPR